MFFTALIARLSTTGRSLLLYLLILGPALLATATLYLHGQIGMTGLLGWSLGLAVLLLAARSYQQLTLGEADTLEQHLVEIATGNLNTPPVAGGASLEALNFLRQRLINAVDSTRQSAHWITSLSDQIFAGSQALDREATDQERQLTQASDAIGAMTRSIQDVSGLTRQGANVTEQTLGAVRLGQQQFMRVTENIGRLEADIRQGAREVNRLDEDIRDIQSVLDNIRGIAEQTNLLALNAAIEAARAGEQGRGFAVVADEVRQLAKRTEEATSETREMIEKLQRGAAGVVGCMEGNANLAADTITSGRSAADAIRDMVTGIEHINELNTQIAAAADRQRQMAEDINRNISQLSGQAAHISGSSRTVFEYAAKVTTIGGEIRTLADRYDLSTATLERSRSQHKKLVEFSSAIDVEVEEINRQHMQLVGIVNELGTIAQHPLCKPFAPRILTSLFGYTQTHFRYEEALMARYGFEGVDEHRKQHLALEQQVVDFKKRIEQGQATVEELLKFLKDWLGYHIQGSDRRYTPHFHNLGIH